MSNGHTPGPWVIGRSGHGQPYQIEDSSGRCVTKWGGISRPASAEGEANARLIASAPELLTLLEEARRTLEMWKDVAPAFSLCDDIDKVIAKARG